MNFSFKYVKKRFNESKYLLILFLPGLIYYVLFRYVPMYGVVIAFKNFNPAAGIWGSPFVGLKHFYSFFANPTSARVIVNTAVLSFQNLLFGFPAPILFALLLNEIKREKTKKLLQTITYLPHFISTVIVVSMMVNFLSPNSGVINQIIVALGGKEVFFMRESSWFRPTYIISGIWKEIGWGAIIYMAALAGIDPELYEAATVDGAGRFKQALHITLPGLIPTIVILFLLRIGNFMEIGFEKVLLMQNGLNLTTSEIISTFVYKRGILGADFSFATAIDLMNNIFGMLLLFAANTITRKVSDNSLW